MSCDAGEVTKRLENEQGPCLKAKLKQILEDLKDPRGHNVEVRRVDLANWALRASPKFTTGVKYQFHQVFFYQIKHPEILITLRPHPLYLARF